MVFRILGSVLSGNAGWFNGTGVSPGVERKSPTENRQGLVVSCVRVICFSVIEDECSFELRQTGWTFSALGPFGPRPAVNDTRWPSWSSS